MAWKTDGIVKGSELEPGDQVYKIGGRWYRIVGWEDRPNERGLGFVRTVAHGEDPRLWTLGRRGSLKVVYAQDDFRMHRLPTPVWDWVTKKLAREAEADRDLAARYGLPAPEPTVHRTCVYCGRYLTEVDYSGTDCQKSPDSAHHMFEVAEAKPEPASERPVKKVHLIYNPNRKGAEVRIHAAGCRDIGRDVKGDRTTRPATSHYECEVVSVLDAAKDFYSDFIDEDPEFYDDETLLSYVDALPCAGLPER